MGSERNRRKATNIVIDAKAQLRFFVPFVVLILTNVAAAVFTSRQAMKFVSQSDSKSPELLAAIQQISNEVIFTLTWSNFIFCLLGFALWLIFSHRIFGPVVPIRRQIQKLTAGDYDGRIALRRHDEFKAVAEDLNLLAETLKNSRGQSLVQVLVAVGIMGTLLAAMASTQSMQARENHALIEKLAAIDLQRALGAALADGSVCKYILNNPTPLTFDSTVLTPTTPQTINLPATSPIISSVSLGPPVQTGPVVAEIGKPASAMAPNVTVKSIQLKINSCTGTSCIGNWIVDFEQAKLVRSVRAAFVSTLLTIDNASPTAAKIVGCNTQVAGGDARSCGPDGKGLLMTFDATTGTPLNTVNPVCCYLMRGLASGGTCGYGAGAVCWHCHDPNNWSTDQFF